MEWAAPLARIYSAAKLSEDPLFPKSHIALLHYAAALARAPPLGAAQAERGTAGYPDRRPCCPSRSIAPGANSRRKHPRALPFPRPAAGRASDLRSTVADFLLAL